MIGKVIATIGLLAVALGIGGVAALWTIDPPNPWPWFMWPMIILFDLGILIATLGGLLTIWLEE